MFSTDGPPRVSTDFQDLSSRLPRLLTLFLIPFIKKDQRVQIAISGVKHVTYKQIVLLSCLKDLVQYFREFRSWNRAIADHVTGS